jgi:hypothetical protein
MANFQKAFKKMLKKFTTDAEKTDETRDHTSRTEEVIKMISSRMVIPYTPAHATWICFSIFMLGYDALVIPLDLSGMIRPEDHTFMIFMTWLIRTFWTLDIFLSFATAYVDTEGNMVTSPLKVASRYIRGQFSLDFIIVLASWLEVFMGSTDGSATGMVRNLKIFRFFRLLRLRKGRQLLLQLSECIRAEKLYVITSLTRMLSMFLLILHIIACCWYWISNFSKSQGHPSWADDVGINPESRSPTELYTYSIHFAISLFSGEHVTQPFNNIERTFMVVVLFCSFVGQIWLVGSITTSMTHLEIVSAKKSKMFFHLERFLTNHNISRDLELKVQRNAKHAMEEMEHHSEEASIELLRMVSEPLLMDLHLEMYGPTIWFHPFFKCCSVANSKSIRAVCHKAVSTQKYQYGDVIFGDMDMPSLGTSANGALIFILEGELTYTQHSTEEAAEDDPQSEEDSRRKTSNISTMESPMSYTSSHGFSARSSHRSREGSHSPSKAHQSEPDEPEPGDVRHQVKRGQWLSEAVLWTKDWLHCGTLRAFTDCRLLMLDATLFRDVMGSWQMPQVNSYAAAFVVGINKGVEDETLTDLMSCSKPLCDQIAATFPEEWREVRDDILPQSMTRSIRRGTAPGSYFLKKASTVQSMKSVTPTDSLRSSVA